MQNSFHDILLAKKSETHSGSKTLAFFSQSFVVEYAKKVIVMDPSDDGYGEKIKQLFRTLGKSQVMCSL